MSAASSLDPFEAPRAVLRACFEAAVESVQGTALLAPVSLERIVGRSPEAFERVRVLGVGKAAASMGAAFERRFPALPFTGFVTVPSGYAQAAPALQRLGLVEAGHPIPDARGVQAAERVWSTTSDLNASDLVVALISGGGSALWSWPQPGLTLRDLAVTNEVLLRSGLPIASVNAVRKRLTRLSAGRLAAHAFPAATCALVLSDVEGDDPGTVASGPATASPQGDAVAFRLREAGAWPHLPLSVRHLLDGVAEQHPAPAPGDPRLARAFSVVVGSNAQARAAAAEAARQRGLGAQVQSLFLRGSAREAGTYVAATAMDFARTCTVPTVLVWGGETTVRVTGSGRGGRSQEMALAVAQALDGRARGITVLCAGTDGRDGPTDAAGAFADEFLFQRARAKGFEPEWHLERHDAYPLLDGTGALLRTGPTHTNVMDLVLAYVSPRGQER